MSIEVSGFEQFERDLEQAARALTDSVQSIPRYVGQKIQQALLLLQGQAAIYPPQPPNSTYVRTGTLGRRWTSAARYLDVGAGGWMIGTVGNNTWYGPYVQDEEQQADVHRGRWHTIQQISQQVQPQMAQFLADAAQEAADELKRRVEA